jgi:hypothetical protein
VGLVVVMVWFWRLVMRHGTNMAERVVFVIVAVQES